LNCNRQTEDKIHCQKLSPAASESSTRTLAAAQKEIEVLD